MRADLASRIVSRKLRPLCQDKYIQTALFANPLVITSVDNIILIYLQFIYVKCLTKSKYMYIIIMTYMGKRIFSQIGTKKAALRLANALHPHPEAVRDDAFLQGGFFDRDDLVQVKYEMLRRHRLDQKPVAEVARTFGTSRQAFYSAKLHFDTEGIPGLIPKKRGPRQAHKCTDDVLDFAEHWKAEHKTEGSRALVAAIGQHFGIVLNPRSVDRALAQRKKKRRLRNETL